MKLLKNPNSIISTETKAKIKNVEAANTVVSTESKSTQNSNYNITGVYTSNDINKSASTSKYSTLDSLVQQGKLDDLFVNKN